MEWVILSSDHVFAGTHGQITYRRKTNHTIGNKDEDNQMK